MLAARCQFLEDWADEVLYWYGIYSQRRIVGHGAAAAAYFRELPEDFRKLAIEVMDASVEKNLHRHGIGRYPKEKVMGDIRRGLDALATFVANDGFAAGPSPSLADFALFGQLHRRLAGTDPLARSGGRGASGTRKLAQSRRRADAALEQSLRTK